MMILEMRTENIFNFKKYTVVRITVIVIVVLLENQMCPTDSFSIVF